MLTNSVKKYIIFTTKLIGSDKMLWYVCLAAVLVLIGFVLKFVFDKKFARMRMFYVMLGCFFIAVVLYIPPYFTNYDFITAIWGCLINVLQVISLDADYLYFYKDIASGIGVDAVTAIYVFLLGTVHVALPAVSALTAVTLFVQYLTRIRMSLVKRSNKTVHIFSQVREESIVLAKDIRKHDKKCEIIFLDDKDKSDYADLRFELRCKVLDERIENIKASAKARKVYYYCISEDEETNLNSALTIMSYLENAEREIQQNNYVYLFTADPSA